jgi:signal transduction histidine kinase/response regulator of citrate/malate metabolism
MQKKILKGIQEINDILKRYAKGETDAVADIRFCEELSGLSDAVNEIIGNAEKEKAEIAALKTHIEISNRARSAFFAAMSHEIRTPMNAIIGMSGLLAEDNLSGEQLDRVISMQTYSDVLLGILDDMLDLSKIDDGSFSLTQTHYNLPALLDNLMPAARLSAREKGLEIIIEYSPDLPDYIYGDSARLRQALNNLLSNAVNFTEKGSVKFSAELKNKLLIFKITDTGVGIKADDVEKIFDPYAQIEGRRARGLPGMGLGLVITNYIISMMKGEIKVESMLGFGSTFTVEIPFEEGNASLSDINADNRYCISAPDAKILLVDDIEINLSVGAGFFKLHDINADTADNAQDAIKLICEKDYDIVFMDHMMPGIDGVKATEIIRKFGGKYDKGSNLKIIALTANVTKEARELMLSSGMDDFLPKPITKSALNRMLLKWLPEDKRVLKRDDFDFELSPDDYTDAIKAAEKIKGLDIKKGLRRSGGTAEAYENSLKLLYRRIPKSITALETFLSDGQIPDFATEVHGMKGAFAINGHSELSKLAAELEYSAKKSDTASIKQKLPLFNKKMTKFCEAVENIFAQNFTEKFTEGTVKTKKSGTNERLKEYINNLVMDVERFDRTRAFGEINRALEYDFGETTGKLLENIKADLEDYDYDSAMEKLQNFKL